MAKNISLSEISMLSGWLLALGILFVIFGFALMLMPVVGTVTIDLLFGVMLLVLGVSEIVFAFTVRKWGGFLFALLGGLLSIVVAAFLLFSPLKGIIALTLLLGAFMFVGGLIKCARAVQLKPNYQWGWLLFDGLISILLGLLIIAAWPSDASWVMGLLFGIYILFGGLSMIMISQAVKQ